MILLHRHYHHNQHSTTNTNTTNNSTTGTIKERNQTRKKEKKKNQQQQKRRRSTRCLCIFSSSSSSSSSLLSSLLLLITFSMVMFQNSNAYHLVISSSLSSSSRNINNNKRNFLHYYYGFAPVTQQQQQQRQRQSRLLSSSSSSNHHENPNDIPNNNDFATTTTAKKETSSSSSSSGFYLPSHPEKRIQTVVAPMVAASDFPFRYMLQNMYGADLVYTQMIHSKHYLTQPSFRKGHYDFYETGYGMNGIIDITTQQQQQEQLLLPTQLKCLGDLPPPTFTGLSSSSNSNSSPLIVQLAGSEPKVVVQAANVIMESTNGRISGFDLNCGCPQHIAKKGNYGAYLMERDPEAVYAVLKALRQAMPSNVAVSAKIRLPVEEEEEDSNNNNRQLKERMSRLLLDTGIDFLTIHGRTIHENKTKVGPCHFDKLRLAVEMAKELRPNDHFPIIANGGMEDYDDMETILSTTGAAAIMSSEALLETPNLFQQSSKLLTPRQRLIQQVTFAKNYLHICATVAGPPVPGVLGLTKDGSMSIIRGHLFKFLHRYFQDHPDLRDQLSSQRPISTIRQAQNLVDELYHRYDHLLKDEDFWKQYPISSTLENSWYRRHRKPDRRVHQKGTGIVVVGPPPPSSSTTTTTNLLTNSDSNSDSIDASGISISSSSPLSSSSTIEEKKREIRNRIRKLQEERKKQQI